MEWMVDRFLKYLQFEKRVSPNTIIAYQNDLTQFKDFLDSNFGEQDAHTANHSMIRSWIVYLVEQNMYNNSVNRKIASLRSFFKYLLRQEIITDDPMLKIRVLKKQKKLPSFVKESDMVSLLDNQVFENNLDGWRTRLMLELFYATGIRLAELISLKENQVDLHNYTIKVLGKRNKERIIPFPKNLVSIIEGYLALRNKEVEKKTDLLFVTDKGERCYPMMIYRIVKQNLQGRTTAERSSPHVLRHTYATHLLNKGAEITAVKDLLGHSSLAATQVYTHNTIEKLKKVFDQAHPKA